MLAMKNIMTIPFLLYILGFFYGCNCIETCNSTFKYMPSETHHLAAQFITNTACRKKVYCHKGQSNNNDRLLYIKGSKPKQEFILCISPKAGVSRIKQLLFKILNKDYDGAFSDNLYESSKYNPLESMSAENADKILRNKQIPKFILVRNPFVRAISMYEDKILKQNAQFLRNLGFDKKANVSFEQFVEQLYKRQCKQVGDFKRLDKHFLQQTKNCKMHMGISYNYVLKMEEMDSWFDCFVDMLNIREEVMHGWSKYDECYLSTTKTPCNGVTYKNGIMGHTEQVLSEHSFPRHATNSSAKLADYYKNKTILQMVAEIFESDIINFDYAIPV